MRKLLTLFILILLVLPLAASAKKGKPAPTAPGKYTDWGGEIDTLEIAQAFKVSDYESIAVEPFDTSSTPLPEANDNTYAPVKSVLGRVTQPFVEGLQASFSELPVSTPEGKASGKALVVRCKVLQMDPGSRAARYWAGFGAGAARVELSGELVDAATGNVLLRFTQERRSGFGVAGGDYEKLMERTLGQIGGDLAMVLAAF